MYAEVAVCLPFLQTFLYEISGRTPLPARVTVPFKNREIQGFVVGFREDKPEELDEIRPVLEVLDPEPLIRGEVFELCRWIADYYMAPLGEVLKGALPPAITAKQLAEFASSKPRPHILPSVPRLTSAQESAFSAITGELGFKAMLLHGVTGSGKTEIYMRSVEHFQRLGKTALVLVPEIGLTPQLRERFTARFGSRLAVLHSSLTQKQRVHEWLRIYKHEASIVIGTRSALFAPLENLGIIVVDEEHEGSYKQDSLPRYHARDCAVMRAKMAGAVAVLGSATPSMESFRNAETKRYAYIHLPDRVEERSLPKVGIINMRDEYAEQGEQVVLCRALVDGIEDRLERDEQTIILLNRRGFSMFLLCRHCGYSFECRDCSVSMTYHRSIRRLLCHYCGFTRKPEATCPECKSEFIQYVGEGTEQVEALLKERFGTARIGRVDRDTMRHLRDYDRILRDFRTGKLDILVGTQMVAKGHDFPKVTLVGVISADSALALPDFRAAERTFQLMTQVAGRSGRGNTPGEVVIQSYFPGHYTFQLASTQRFEEFYAREIRFRQAMFYPPFTVLAGVRVLEMSRDRVAGLAREIGDFLDSVRSRSVRILGPAPAAVEKINRTYRHQLLIKSATREPLHRVLGQLQSYMAEHKISPTRVVIDVDPISLL
jgi:primosomal protein N' (replication factor Y)